MLKTNSLAKALSSFAYNNPTANSDFASDFTNWTNGGTFTASIDTSISLFGSKSFKAVYAAQTGYKFQSISFTNGNKIYCAGSIYLTAADAGSRYSLSVNDYGNASGSTQYSYADITKLNQWQRLSKIYTAANNGVNIRLGTVSPVTGTGYYDGIMAYDLTAIFGSGNEPAVGDCDNIFKYVNGQLQANLSKVLQT